MPKSKEELKVQLKICEYIRENHPDLLFNSTMDGIRLTIGQATLQKRLRSIAISYDPDDPDKFPDLSIYKTNECYSGLFIELKVKPIFKKNGELYSSSHLKKQAETLRRLSLQGYLAVFAVGYDEAIRVIEDYLIIKS